MIERIVRMKFKSESVSDFEELFKKHKDQIRNFEGCSHLELWRDSSDPDTFYTFSKWENESKLEEYRNSELFGRVWTATKVLFAKKAQAFSAVKYL